MLLQTRASGDTEPVSTDGITQKGFMQLLMHMVEHERADLVWRMLFMFGYDRSLGLAPELTQGIPQRTSHPVRSAADSVVSVSFQCRYAISICTLFVGHSSGVFARPDGPPCCRGRMHMHLGAKTTSGCVPER